MSPEPEKTVVAPVKPLEVTMIGTGDGGVPIPSGTIATTPDHQPNLIVNVVGPLAAILVRFVNLYLTTLVGLVAAGMTPAGSSLLKTGDFYHLVLTCASLALPGAALGLIKDVVTVFGRLEQKYPLLTGSI